MKTKTSKMNGNQLKRIDFEKGFFEANGKKYFIEGGMSIERYAEFQIYEKELAYGLTVKGLFDKLGELWRMLNKLKFADAAVLLNDIIRGVSKLEDREPVVLKICALVINEENEDRTQFSQDMITRKILDWKTEGISMADFFRVASGSVNGLQEIYRKAARIISGEASLEDSE